MESLLHFIDSLTTKQNINDDILNIIRKADNYFNSKQISLEFEDIISLLKNSQSLCLIFEQFIKQKSGEKGSYNEFFKKYIKSEALMEALEVYFTKNHTDDELYDFDGDSLSVNIDNSLKQYYHDIQRYKILSREEEQELAIKAQNGSKEAKDQLIMSNLRLVISIAKNYQNRGLELIDLIQYGNMGLITAVEKFDPSLGYKLSTYATWWIRQSIVRSIADYGRMIRYPIHFNEIINKINRVISDLTIEYNAKPTVEQIAKRLNMPPEKVSEYMAYTGDVFSLDAPIADEDSSPLEEFIPDSSDLQDDVCSKDEISYILSVINRDDFDPRLSEIIKRRFGVDGYQRMSLQDIGEELQLTRERVRQLEEKALRKIRLECKKDEVRKVIEENTQKETQNGKDKLRTPNDYKYNKYTFGIKAQNSEDHYWNKMYILIKNYKSKYGNLFIDPSFKTLDGILYREDGVSLTEWIFKQYEELDNETLSPEKEEALAEIGITKEDWIKSFLMLKQYIYGYEHQRDDMPQYTLQWFINQMRILTERKVVNKDIIEHTRAFTIIGIDFEWIKRFIMCYDDIKNNIELTSIKKRWLKSQQLSYDLYNLPDYQYVLLKDILKLDDNMTLKRT